eukprot:348914_1
MIKKKQIDFKTEINIIENKIKELNKDIEKKKKNMLNEENKSDEIQKETSNKRKIVNDKKKQIDLKRKEITNKIKEKGNLKGWIEKLSQTQKNILSQAKHEMILLKNKNKKKKNWT